MTAREGGARGERRERERERGARKKRKPGGEMSVREAGRKGGEARKSQLGKEGYAELGRKGGEAVARSRGRGFYEEIGHKGGEARREQLGPSGYRELGRKGGEARRRQLGPRGYAELGHRGGQRVRELIERGKQAAAGERVEREGAREEMKPQHKRQYPASIGKGGTVPEEELIPPGAEESEAVGISAVVRAIGDIEFPISRDELIRRMGEREVEVARGRTMPFRDLIADFHEGGVRGGTSLSPPGEERIETLEPLLRFVSERLRAMAGERRAWGAAQREGGRGDAEEPPLM